MNLQTEFEFELPMGYVDKEGNLHKKGSMRLATAMDEITILNDMRVQANEAYIVIVLLSRVITRLGSLSAINYQRDREPVCRRPDLFAGILPADQRRRKYTTRVCMPPTVRKLLKWT